MSDTKIPQQSQDQPPKATQEPGHSPHPSTANPSGSGNVQPRRLENRQPRPGLATGLANDVLGGRNRVSNGPTPTRITRRSGNAAVRRRKKTSNAFYVIFEDCEPIEICKGWLAARRKSANISGRWCKRFNTREEAQAFFDNPDGDSSDGDRQDDFFEFE